ncbi:carbohydrate kinase [Halostella sp. JP-L12]|uniref:carbohydrate kinase family protein n=1 Tax=Halostella TaxID=1843185 RepID=UPI000EF768C7|nr:MULTISPECIES: carbohydrate kinase [Halostella]NHN49055.1 carbohydrate kinase [Halostella sp. JP-L12]
MSHDVLVAGETLVDFIPDAPGALDEIDAFARRAGGAPANVAVALARLDEAPLFWTRVGADPFGDFLADTLSEYGVPDRFVERDPSAKTTLAFVTHDEDADRSFSFYRDGTADTRMQSGAVPDDALDSVEWVHVGGVTLADEPSRTATLDLTERAAERGCTVSFDPNARPELWGSDAEFETVAGWALAETNVLKATPAELRALGVAGDDPEALARNACDEGPHTVLLTLGGEGALAVATDEAPWSGTARHAGYSVDPVDTTGAGDAFTAGAIAALADRRGLDEALAFANAVAATTTTAKGAMAALPDRESVGAVRD